MKQAWVLNEALSNNPKRMLKIQRKTSKDYLFEYGGKIASDPELLQAAHQTLTIVQKKGGNPVALAAGALYYAYKLTKTNISKDQIAQAFGISARTVDTNERKIRHLATIVPSQQELVASIIVTSQTLSSTSH